MWHARLGTRPLGIRFIRARRAADLEDGDDATRVTEPARMSLLERLMTWLPGRKSRTTALALADAPTTDSTVILHLPQAEETEAEPDLVDDFGDPDEAWFMPRSVPVLHAPHAVDCEPIDTSLHEAIVAVLRESDLELPRLPQITQSALGLLSKPDFNQRQLAELIGRDPMLAASVLRTANSALYRGVSAITRLETAFARIGQRTLHGIVLSENVKALAIRVSSGGERSLGQELWQRSIASAAIAARFAERLKLAEDEAFLLGLLHDIGMLAMLRVVHDYQTAHGRRVSRPLFDALCDEWHEQLGLRLADAWNLPTPLPELIGSHHKEPAADDPLRPQRQLLQFTDVATSMLGYAPYVSYDFFRMPCVIALGIHDVPATRELLLELPDLIERRAALT